MYARGVISKELRDWLIEFYMLRSVLRNRYKKINLAVSINMKFAIIGSMTTLTTGQKKNTKYRKISE